MNDFYDIGIIGMGPAGIGFAHSMMKKDRLRSIVCFERGRKATDKECNLTEKMACNDHDICSIISGIGGSACFSSGKISMFPAGSGLIDFFETKNELTSFMDYSMSVLKKSMHLKKVKVNDETINETEEYYKSKGVVYKYYDVFEFERKGYNAFINDSVRELISNGLKIIDNSEVLSIEKDYVRGCFRIIVKALEKEECYIVRDIIIATGGLDIGSRIIEDITGRENCDYEMGIRLEVPSAYLQDARKTHGDLKLKYNRGRTYCVTHEGRVVAYNTEGMLFVEGSNEQCVDSGYSNLAILIKAKGNTCFNEFKASYFDCFRGIPVKQYYSDYKAQVASKDDIKCTLPIARIGNVNKLFPEEINTAIKEFVDKVIVHIMGVPNDRIVVIAPEIKILRNLGLSKNFELDDHVYVIGAATGKFRGILQSFCSGVKCGQQFEGE